MQGSLNATMQGQSFGNVMTQGIVGGISGMTGGYAGQAFSKLGMGVMINKFSITSPVFVGGVTGAVGGAGGGYVGGFTAGLLTTGDLAQAHKMGTSSDWSGAAIGAGVGSGSAYYSARQQGIDPWTGLSKKTQDEFIDLMGRMRKNKVSITYIDHHDIDPTVVTALKKLKVKVIHDINECTTVQVYAAYKSKLNDHASFVATCAAITDYMEDRPLGSKLLQIYDRQFALISATVMTYNIVGHQREPDYLQYLVEELADSKFPHDIPNTFEFAQIQVEKLSQIIAKVKKGMKTMSNLGHMEILDSGASGAVNFVMGLSGKDVGVAYKERIDHGIYAVSVRGSKNCKVHLGKIVNLLATSLGGSGGGHDKACGAVVPKPKIKKFITELNKKIK